MATKKTQIQIKRNSSSTYDVGDITLRIGEPFYNKPTNDFFVGDGMNMLKNMIPLSHNPIIANHEVINGSHKFRITNGTIGSLTVFPVVCKFNMNYSAGQNVTLEIPTLDGSSVTYTVIGVKSTQGTILGNNAFVANTVNCFYVSLEDLAARTAYIFFASGSGSGPAPTATYTVTYNSNGKSAANMPSTLTHNAGESVVLSSMVPVVSGFNFVGWDMSSTATTASYRQGQNIGVMDANITLYAIWEQGSAEKIRIDFNKNTSSDPSSSDYKEVPYDNDVISGLPTSIEVDIGTEYTLPAGPSVNGYIFAGWLIDGYETILQPGESIVITGPISIKPVWERESGYTVKFFSKNTEIVGYRMSNKLYREVIDISRCTAESTGENFIGWKQGSKGPYTTNYTVESTTKDIRLDAYFTTTPTTMFTVTYDANGGIYEVEPFDSGTQKKGNTEVIVDFTHLPIKEGFEFTGYKDQNNNLYTADGTQSFLITENTTLTAQWRVIPKYTLSYTSDYGTAPEAVTLEENFITLAFPTASMLAESSAAHKCFIGWRVEGYDEYQHPDDAISIPEGEFASTAEAMFITINETIATGSHSPARVPFQEDGSDMYVVYSSKEPSTLYGPEEGLVVVMDDAELDDYIVCQGTVEGGDFLVLCIKVRPDYKVEFSSEHGSSIPAQYVAENQLVNQPATPVASGYTFTGWYKDSALATPWNFVTDRVTANTTIYAGWEAIPEPPTQHTVSFNSKYGSQATVHVETALYTLPNPSDSIKEEALRASRVFDHWANAASQPSGDVHGVDGYSNWKPGHEINLTTTTASGDIVLSAQFTFVAFTYEDSLGLDAPAGEPGQPTVTLKNPTSVMLRALTTHHKVFAGWTINGVDYNAGDTYNLPGDGIAANYKAISRYIDVSDTDEQHIESMEPEPITLSGEHVATRFISGDNALVSLIDTETNKTEYEFIKHGTSNYAIYELVDINDGVLKVVFQGSGYSE